MGVVRHLAVSINRPLVGKWLVSCSVLPDGHEGRSARCLVDQDCADAVEGGKCVRERIGA